MNLSEVIEETKERPFIDWTFDHKCISGDGGYQTIANNKDGKHGYFKLMENLVRGLDEDAIIVEIGSREGLGILALYNSLKKGQKLYGIDIVGDYKLLPPKVLDDPRVTLFHNFNSLDEERIKGTFKENSIGFAFFDTIHTYEQIAEEYRLWGPYLKEDAVFLIDDIKETMGRTKWDFHQELQCSEKYDVSDWAHNPSGFGAYRR
jgi:hypothetical protein